MSWTSPSWATKSYGPLGLMPGVFSASMAGLICQTKR